MDYKEIRELSNSITAKELLSLIEQFINNMGDTKLRKEISEQKTFHDWHRTLQQCLMQGFIAPAIKALSEEETDDRNRETVLACKEMTATLKKYHFPCI